MNNLLTGNIQLRAESSGSVFLTKPSKTKPHALFFMESYSVSSGHISADWSCIAYLCTSNERQGIKKKIRCVQSCCQVSDMLLQQLPPRGECSAAVPSMFGPRGPPQPGNKQLRGKLSRFNPSALIIENCLKVTQHTQLERLVRE